MASEQPAKCLERNRTTRVVPLHSIASFATHRSELGIVLDALGGDGEPKAVRQHDDRAHDLQRALAAGDVAHEQVVDLDAVEREAVQITKRGIAGSKIVERRNQLSLNKLTGKYSERRRMI